MRSACLALVVEARALARSIEDVAFPGTRPPLAEVIAFAGRVIELHAAQRDDRPWIAREHEELAGALADLIGAVAAWEHCAGAGAGAGFADSDTWRDRRSTALAAARAAADDLTVHQDHEFGAPPLTRPA